ncbi:reverse transcriptase domain-containing protein [Tanacetum coccineum]
MSSSPKSYLPRLRMLLSPNFPGLYPGLPMTMSRFMRKTYFISSSSNRIIRFSSNSFTTLHFFDDPIYEGLHAITRLKSDLFTTYCASIFNAILQCLILQEFFLREEIFVYRNSWKHKTTWQNLIIPPDPREALWQTIVATKSFHELPIINFKVLTEDALSWWKLFCHAYWDRRRITSIPWVEFKKLLIKKYCPRTEVQKMEDEFYHLTVKGKDLKTYVRRFQELATLCPTMVPDFEKMMEVFIGGLP